MNPDRWREVEAVFHRIVDEPPSRRAALLEELTATDAPLRDIVARMVELDERSTSLVDAPIFRRAFGRDDGAARDAFDDPLIGQVIGGYRVLAEVGAGGMGVIYRGEPIDNPGAPAVAIKVVRRGMDTDTVLRRFRFERAALEQLRHPNIAALLDVGALDDGRPFLVMEYVDGMPIDEYCDAHRLPVEARLRLFHTVCFAVHDAHRHLIVHRDLKPSNILVTPAGAPKLVDFGIAKLLDDDGSLERTATAGRMLTPHYASPEQIRGDPVNTSSDIYSLGVVLFVLLTGRKPFGATSGLSANRLADREPLDREPTRPSTFVAAQTQAALNDPQTTISLREIAQLRSTTPPRLKRSLRGDLDNIVMTALRPEPARRYQSAGELAADLDRYLEGRPVSARPDTLGYRASKFVRRHRVAVAAGSLVTAAIITGLASTGVMGLIALEQRDAARAAQARATRHADAATVQADASRDIASILTASMQAAMETLTPQQHQAMLAQLAREAGRARRQYRSDPEIQAIVLDAIGRMYMDLNVVEEARSLFTEAFELRREALGDDTLAAAFSRNSLGELAYRLGEFDRAEELFRQALVIQRRHAEEPDANLSLALNNLGAVLRSRGEHQEAADLHREALAIRIEEHGEESLPVAESLNNLSGVFIELARFDEAIAALERSMEMRVALLGETHPLTVQSMNNLAVVHAHRRQWDEAESLYQRAMAAAAKSGDPQGELYMAGNLAHVLLESDRAAEALPLLERVLPHVRQSRGERHVSVAVTLLRLAQAQEKTGSAEQARRSFDESLSIYRETFGENSPQLATPLHNYGGFLQRAGRLDEAEPVLRKALELHRASIGDEHPATIRAALTLGACLQEMEQFDEAEALFSRSRDDAEAARLGRERDMAERALEVLAQAR